MQWFKDKHYTSFSEFQKQVESEYTELNNKWLSMSQAGLIAKSDDITYIRAVYEIITEQIDDESFKYAEIGVKDIPVLDENLVAIASYTQDVSDVINFSSDFGSCGNQWLNPMEWFTSYVQDILDCPR